jgi:predicted Zn-dependent protease with MMP-like domain
MRSTVADDVRILHPPFAKVVGGLDVTLATTHGEVDNRVSYQHCVPSPRRCGKGWSIIEHLFDPSSESVDVDAVIGDVLEHLPEPFREHLGSVAIVLEDEATPEQLARLRVQGLYGLYEGIPRTRWGVDNAAVANKITLFLGPLARANPSPERFRAAIEDTLLHEIAHHFGIDDARLRELAAERRGGA